MRPNPDPILPINPETPYEKLLNLRLKDIFRVLISKINSLSDGQLSAIDNASAAVPTTGTFAKGDFIRNNAPAELGAGGNKYVIYGWVCVTGGPAGTFAFVQCRFLTGN